MTQPFLSIDPWEMKAYVYFYKRTCTKMFLAGLFIMKKQQEKKTQQETTPMSINMWTGEQTVVYPHNGYSLIKRVNYWYTQHVCISK